MGYFGCLCKCYSNSFVYDPSEEKLVAHIIKNLLVDILNEYDKYITLSNISQSKNTYYRDIDKIMEELSEIFEDITQNKK